jgi:gamma-glutamyltranspeptidase/glutathione hydrolase
MSTSPTRARIIGTRHMVAAGHYLAAQAAFQILEAGGNAIDAGVCGGIALGVVQSEYVSFGGVAPIMIRPASTGQVFTISGLGCWPKVASLETFHGNYDGRIPPGILRTVVPAAPDAWITALERWGTMTFADVAAAAVRFATNGFAMPELMSRIITKAADNYRQWPDNAEIYLPGGEPPQPGDIFKQTDLGRTIQYMIDQETYAKGDRKAGLQAARHAFYVGDIATTMVRHQAENGGWMTADDLVEFHVGIESPTTVKFGDLQVFTCGPWCQGPVLAQTLRMLDGIDIATLGHNEPAYVHTIVEAFKLAYADRHRYVGDPRFVDVPIAGMLDDAYIAARRGLIDTQIAHPGMPKPGHPEGAAWTDFIEPQPTTPADEISQLDTSYISVVDSEGSVFSATPSDGSAGGPIVPGLGFVPSGRGSQSSTDPAQPAVLAPGKRPRLTPNPAIAVRGNRWVMPFGSPGNDVQPQAMVQVLLNIVQFGMTPQEAIDQPRFATFSYPRSSDPHSFSPGLMNLEGRFPSETAARLSTMGHDVAMWPDWEYQAGGVCAIVHDREAGTMEGGSDPRRPTAVIGW